MDVTDPLNDVLIVSVRFMLKVGVGTTEPDKVVDIVTVLFTL